MCQTILSRDRNLSIIYQGERKELFTEPYWGSLKGQDRSNGIVSWYKFTENFCKYNANRTISVFDKNWLKWRIRVNPYCLWLAFVRNISKLKNEPFEPYVLFTKNDHFYETIYGPYCIVPEWSLSNKFKKTNKKQNSFCKKVIENLWKDDVVQIIFHTLDLNLLQILSK